MEHFQRTKPCHTQLHWDGKLMKDALGKDWEAEAILVSGSPDWIEGKLLDVANLQNEDGNPCSTGEVQFEATKKAVLLWDIRDSLRSFCFDTTASNTGVHRGCCIRLSTMFANIIFRNSWPKLPGMQFLTKTQDLKTES